MTLSLVGDVGGTSADWALIRNGECEYSQTMGFNPSSQSSQRLIDLLLQLQEQIGKPTSLQIYYYGAGTNIRGAKSKIEYQFQQSFPGCQIVIESDLLGAARAVCGDEASLVAILGTGSNICHYNGMDIDIPGISLGFPLGDEGSGADIGTRLFKAFYYQNMPSELSEIFARNFPPDYVDFLRMYYQSQAPNKLMASCMAMLQDQLEHPYVVDQAKAAFTDFIAQHLSRFKTYQKISLVGSIAFYFCAVIREVFQRHGYEVGDIIKAPIESLASWHCQQNS